MTPFTILVAQTEPDICAELIAQQLRSYPDVQLFGGRVFGIDEIDALLQLKKDRPGAAIIVGQAPDVDRVCLSLASAHKRLVVVRMTSVGDLVRFDARNINLQTMIEAARRLAEAPASPAERRIARFFLSAMNGRAMPEAGDQQNAPANTHRERPIVDAIVKWLHQLLTHAVVRQREQPESARPKVVASLDEVAGRAAGAAAGSDTGASNADHIEASAETRAPESLRGLALSPNALERALETPGPGDAPAADAQVDALEQTLFEQLDATDPIDDPFAALYHSLRLTPLEMKAFLVAFAPEFDVRYQRCFGLLLDELGRRNTTLPLIASLLGEPAAVRRQLSVSDRLGRWRLFETSAAHALASDESVRVDAALVGWLFGNALALRADARLAQALILEPWPGARLLCSEQDDALAADIAKCLDANGRPYWMVLVGEDLAGWRALIERAVDHHKLNIVRISLAKLETLDRYDLADVIARLARLIRLTHTAPIVHFTYTDSPARAEEMLRRVAAAVVGGKGRAALITHEPERCVPLLGPVEASLHDRAALDTSRRAAILGAAAQEIGAPLSEGEASSLAAAFPLEVDGVFCAARLVSATKRRDDSPEELHQKLRTACRRAASQNVSRLVQRIEPTFDLEAVKLPEDRIRQLKEILANVQLSTKVLDDWRFANLLPYGRGVTALFHGPSGTGKTMAAQAIAKELCIEVFLVDLSRVVSKYIGETEKNLDIVFAETQRSGGLLLLDEAEALLGKRSEVKDSHDRYANMEVAFLLQRMETFSGLAILTTNLRQNLDQAFLRRLRFIVDFPKPDAAAREQIWRLCLPDDAHALRAEEFRLLGRKVDLTGGSIRQISVRAAFLAAADRKNESQRIEMRHVLEAARAELAKLGLPAPLLDIGSKDGAEKVA